MENKHILIVNLGKDIRIWLADILRQIGYQKISLVENGRRAVDILNHSKIDLVITDIPLGDIDGWRLTRLIRSNILKTPSSTPVIAVSSIYSERIAEITAREYEINHFCTYDELAQLPVLIHEIFNNPYKTDKASLLVIEDYQDTINLIHRILDKQFDIETATDGESGLAAWKERQHDLILLDVMLPNMSGEEVLENILKIDPHQAVVVMTAHGSAECAGSLILKGAVDFISKPFRAEQLRRICNIASRREDFIISNEQYAQHTEELRSSETRFRRLVENLKEDYFFYTRDPQGNYTYLSPSLTTVLGYSPEEYISNYHCYYTDNPINTIAKNHSQLSLQGVQQPPYEFEMRHKNGSICNFTVTETPVLQKNQVIAIDGIIHDITPRVTMQKQLKQLADATYEAVIIHRKGEILEANQVYTELTGFSHDDTIGKNLCDILISKKNDLACEYIINDKVLPHELDIRDCHGTDIPVEVRTREIKFNGEPATVLSIRNLTLQKKAEEMHSQLKQAQKMEAIGQLTGGIAHDFNNILASILGYSELAIDKYATDKNSKLATYLSEIHTAAERARDLIQQMLSFSRKSTVNQQPHHLKPIIAETLKLLGPTMPSSIALNFVADNEVPPVLIDPIQLHQIIMNTCINARDAIPDQVGSIELRLSPPAFFTECCSSCYRSFSGQFITLTIHDTGTGIDPLLNEKVFDPFFSTKDVGKGTGMGLSMVHGIIHEHAGHILLRSAPGVGTTFTLLMPAYQGDIKTNNSVEPVNGSKHGNGNILVVDDDVSLSHFMRELLQTYGYQVTVVNDPRDAINVFEKNPNNFDLIITDQTMPNIPGDALATSILEKHPSVPIILCTGYSERIDEEKAMALNIKGFLSKPIETKKLIHMMEKLLNKPDYDALPM